MMKRISALLLVLCMMLSVVPAMAEAVTGEATAQGFGGEVKVTVTVDNGVITNVTAVGADETPAIGGVAMEKLAAAMMENNTINVDAMTTATVTSNAVLSAAAESRAKILFLPRYLIWSSQHKYL